jgi:uncharacterized membrane protein
MSILSELIEQLKLLTNMLNDHTKELFQIIDHLTHLSCKLVSTIGTLILIIAVLLALINIKLMFINSIFGFELKMITSLSYGGTPSNSRKIATFGRVRQQLGEVTALGLEILIVSDILETLTKPVNQFRLVIHLNDIIRTISFLIYNNSLFCLHYY